MDTLAVVGGRVGDNGDGEEVVGVAALTGHMHWHQLCLSPSYLSLSPTSSFLSIHCNH